MPQLSVGFMSDVQAVAGLLVGEECDTRSVYNASGVVIPFGSVTAYSATLQNVVVPSATGAKLAGIVPFVRLYEDAKDSLNRYGIPDKRQLQIVKEGIIWVYCEEDIAINDAVYFRHTANGAGKLNVGTGFRNDADTATCDLIPATNARWVSSGKSGKFAQLSITLP
jgi:hypothetical protein